MQRNFVYLLKWMKVILAVIEKKKRGRGAAGKIIVFGLLKRGEKVFYSPSIQHQNSHAITDYSPENQT